MTDVPKEAQVILGQLCKDYPDFVFLAIPNNQTKDQFIQTFHNTFNTNKKK